MKQMGRSHRPFYRICAMDSRSARDGRVIEELGTYDPFVPETDARVVLKADRIDYWKSVGAKPTPKVAVLIRKYGTEGTHLDQQKSAIERLGERRQKAVSAALEAANNLPAPPEPEAAPAPAEEGAAAEAAEATAEGAEATAETAEAAPAAEAPAAEEAAPAAEAPAEEKAAPAAEEAPAAEAPAAEAPAAEAPAEE